MEEGSLSAGTLQGNVSSMSKAKPRMEGIPLRCWEEFEEAALRTISETERLREERGTHVDFPLFRGVRDSSKPLQSPLDRVKTGISLSEYWRIIRIVHKHVETVTGRKWDLNTKISFEIGFDLPAYEFMAYLRQNGFPSPLLDWTRSPYVAAFFAFRDMERERADEKHVSIFMLRELCGNGKGWAPHESHIHTLGPCIATCRTHYLQQSQYSICVRREGEETYFANYEDVAYGDQNEEEQDVLIKYNVPASEQAKVLRRLDSMNITAYSLFGSESSLMDTLAIRELVLEKG
jgi:hypothetical protein